MIGQLKDLTMNRDETQNLTILLHADFREAYDELNGKDIDITIKKASKHRSLDANAFFWNLCSEIAKRSSKYSTDGKNDVYREAVRAKGEFEPLLIRKDALERFIYRWGDKGIGWFVDVVDDHGKDYKIVHAYYGSSTYDSLSMSRIIDYVVNIANDLGIPTITEKEMERLLGNWAKKVEKHEQKHNAG